MLGPAASIITAPAICRRFFDALSGRDQRAGDGRRSYKTKAALVIGADLSQQHPLLAFQLRANFRHHKASIYTVTEGPVRERKYARLTRIAEPARQLDEVEALRAELAAQSGTRHPVWRYGQGRRHPATGCLWRLAGHSGQVRLPRRLLELARRIRHGPAARSRRRISRGGIAWTELPEILTARDLDVVWIVGANPLANAQLASDGAFVVVQEMFMTETAKRADVIFPAASAYEKDGTFTNVTGEVQQLKRAAKTMGAKPDLEIFGLIAKEMGSIRFPASHGRRRL